MAALTEDRNTRRRAQQAFSDPVAADAVIYAGALVCLDAAGNAVPGSTATGLTARGVAIRRVDNTGGVAGAVRVDVDPASGARFANSSGADQITRADIGSAAWIVDDQTVAKTNGDSGSGATRSQAGTIIDVDDVGVWIKFG